MAWTPWKLMANHLSWFDDHTLRVPVVCYQLGLGESESKDEPEVMYVGIGRSEYHEASAFAKGERELCARIQPELEKGLTLYWRCRGAPDLDGARAIQQELLAEASYPWND